MIQGKNIIIFGSDKWEYPGMQQTIMRLLSRHNRILFVSPLGTRKISIKFSEIGIYSKRALRMFKRDNHHGGESSNGVFFCNPWMIPLVYNKMIMQFNRSLMQAQFSGLLSRLAFDEYILWIGTPTAASFLDLFEPTLLIYNPVDRYSKFSFVDSEKIAEYERVVASRADAIICTADAIRRDLEPYNRHCFTVTHGVDVNHFHSAFRKNGVPEDLRNIPGPIIGFIGGIADWVNFDLLLEVSRRYPDANLVLIGRTYPEVRGLERLKMQPNIHFLGQKDYKVLPEYLKHFSVCLIPYVINERLIAVDPIKLREYLTLGKPVVSVDLPEVRKLQEVVYIGKNNEDFVNKIGKALKENDPGTIEDRIRVAWKSDWGAKIEEISEIIRGALRRKHSLTDGSDPSSRFGGKREVSE
jgi:glycosyltransferase involved in cell wall biosynthesis